MNIPPATICFLFYVTTVTIFRASIVQANQKSQNWTALSLSDDLFVWKFTIWRSRAFLAIPRWETGRKVIPEASATLYETSFPIIRGNKILPFGTQTHLGCPRSATGLGIDARGRFWILEAPDKYECWARIVVYDLRRNNQLITSTQLKNVPTKNLRALALDPRDPTAYIGDPGDESIVVFNLGKRRWSRIKLIHGPEIQRIHSADLAISRRDSVLYMTGPDTFDLFSLNLDRLRGEESSSLYSNKSQNGIALWHGTKLGLSSGLFCDVRGGLHYFMTTEKASVRWDTRLPLKAESHSVMLQDANYPCITDYATDSQKNVWALVNSERPFRRNEPWQGLKARIVKIMNL